MALNPVVYTEKVGRSFLRYQLTARTRFADERLHRQIRRLLSLGEIRQLAESERLRTELPEREKHRADVGDVNARHGDAKALQRVRREVVRVESCFAEAGDNGVPKVPIHRDKPRRMNSFFAAPRPVSVASRKSLRGLSRAAGLVLQRVTSQCKS